MSKYQYAYKWDEACSSQSKAMQCNSMQYMIQFAVSVFKIYFTIYVCIYKAHLYSIDRMRDSSLAQLRRSGEHWMCEVCVHLILKIHFHIYIANRHNSHLLTNALTEIDLHEHQQFIHSHLHPALCDASSINSKCAKMAMVILIWNVFVLLDIKCSLCDDFTITSLMLSCECRSVGDIYAICLCIWDWCCRNLLLLTSS